MRYPKSFIYSVFVFLLGMISATYLPAPKGGGAESSGAGAAASVAAASVAAAAASHSASVHSGAAAASPHQSLREIDWSKKVLRPQDAGPLADRTDIYAHVDSIVPLFVVRDSNQVREFAGKRYKNVYVPDMSVWDDWRACAPVGMRLKTISVIDLKLNQARGSHDLSPLEHVDMALRSRVSPKPMTDEMTEACRRGLNNHYLILNHQGTKKFSVLYVFVNLTQSHEKGLLRYLRPTLSLGSVISLLTKAREILDQGEALHNLDLRYRLHDFKPHLKKETGEFHEVDDILHIPHEYDASKTHYGPLLPLLFAKEEDAFIAFLGSATGYNRTKPAKR